MNTVVPCAAGPADAQCARAAERRLELSGRVDTLSGTPVAGARVELWHADPSGRHCHPSAPEGDPT